MKMGRNWAVSLMSCSVVPTSSSTEIRAARDEFLIRAMNSVPSGATTVRKAWGSTMIRRTWGKVRPRARAASPWPRATAFTPERTISPTKAPV